MSNSGADLVIGVEFGGDGASAVIHLAPCTGSGKEAAQLLLTALKPSPLYEIRIFDK